MCYEIFFKKEIPASDTALLTQEAADENHEAIAPQKRSLLKRSLFLSLVAFLKASKPPLRFLECLWTPNGSENIFKLRLYTSDLVKIKANSI